VVVGVLYGLVWARVEWVNESVNVGYVVAFINVSFFCPFGSKRADRIMLIFMSHGLPAWMLLDVHTFHS
jgi:hypothetical protein